MSQFDKFTERARKVLQLAQEEAQRFNHNYIGTEHLLLGLVREGDGVAARVLSNMNVQLPKVRSAVEFIIGRGEATVVGDIGLTPRAKKVLELAVDEGRRLNHHYIGTEHLLLGLVREGEGIAAGVLESLGVNLEKVRSQVMQVVLQGPIAHGGTGSMLPFRRQMMVGQPAGVGELNPQTIALLARAVHEATTRRHYRVTAAHLLLALVDDESESVTRLKRRLGKRLAELRSLVSAHLADLRSDSEQPQELTPACLDMLQLAKYMPPLTKQVGVGPEEVFLALAWSGADMGKYILERRTGNDPIRRAEAQLLVDLKNDLTRIERLLLKPPAKPRKRKQPDEPKS
jgi:ATP-dependent Clp protease ATP-binding subunit ClpA